MHLDAADMTVMQLSERGQAEDAVTTPAVMF